MYHIATLLVVGLASALFGWAVVHITARLERERQGRHAERFGEHPAAERAALTKPPWTRFLGRWLLP